MSRHFSKLSSVLQRPPGGFVGIIKQCGRQSTAASVNNPNDDELLKSAKPFHMMPAPPMWPIIGTAWLFLPIVGRYSVLRSNHANRHKRQLYGNIWREKLGKNSFVISFQADDMETVYRHEGPYPSRNEFTCLKAYRESRKQWYKTTGVIILEGKEWHDLRTKTQKHLMKPKAVEAYVGAMQDIAKDFVQRMSQIKDSKGEVPDYLQEMYKWSLESVAFVGLDARLGTFQSTDSDGLRMIQAVQTQFELMNKLEGFLGNIPFWKIIPTPKWRKFEKASDVFSEIAFKYINRACDELKNKADDEELTLLQAMLATKGLELDGAMVTVADMLFGGIDTTSHAAAFFLYELARNPDKQERLHQEINEMLSNNAGRLSSHLLSELKYLKACLKESLRLHPVVAVVARVLDHDVALSGYRVPKKTVIVTMMEEMSRDERYFKNPSQFHPERWLNRNKMTNPFAYLPFGFGLRSCLGRRLAELEILCLITEIIKKFKVEYKYEDIDVLTKFVNTPDKPLKFNFVDRS